MHGIPVFYSFHHHIVLGSTQKAFVVVCTFSSAMKRTDFVFILRKPPILIFSIWKMWHSPALNACVVFRRK